MAEYTVFGLIDVDSGELLVAGVVDGDRAQCLALEIMASPDLQRWSGVFEADSAEQAQECALRSVEYPDEG